MEFLPLLSRLSDSISSNAGDNATASTPAQRMLHVGFLPELQQRLLLLGTYAFSCKQGAYLRTAAGASGMSGEPQLPEHVSLHDFTSVLQGIVKSLPLEVWCTADSAGNSATVTMEESACQLLQQLLSSPASLAVVATRGLALEVREAAAAGSVAADCCMDAVRSLFSRVAYQLAFGRALSLLDLELRRELCLKMAVVLNTKEVLPFLELMSPLQNQGEYRTLQ